MRNLADLAVDLLCSLTFQPIDGHDPDDLAALEQEAWQTLMHDLTPDELDAVRHSVRKSIASLESQPGSHLPPHLEQKLSVLRQFLDGQLE